MVELHNSVYKGLVSSRYWTCYRVAYRVPRRKVIKSKEIKETKKRKLSSIKMTLPSNVTDLTTSRF